MSAYRWARPDGPRVLFAHANGFNARTYLRLLAPLAEHYEVIAVDLRGHGRTDLAIDPDAHRSWDVHARDLAAVIEHLSDRPLILAGHSMGATSQLMAAERIDAPLLGLALIEPVVMPAHVYAVMHTPLGPVMSNRLSIVKNARTRMDGWDSREAVKARYGSKPTFSGWDEGMLADYLQDGLVQRGGEWRLACPPEWEAANFAAQRNRPLAAARSITAPIAVLKAERGSTLRNPEGLGKAGAVITEWAGASHLVAMEQRDAVAQWLIAQCAMFDSNPVPASSRSPT